MQIMMQGWMGIYVFVERMQEIGLALRKLAGITLQVMVFSASVSL